MDEFCFSSLPVFTAHWLPASERKTYWFQSKLCTLFSVNLNYSQYIAIFIYCQQKNENFHAIGKRVIFGAIYHAEKIIYEKRGSQVHIYV